MAFLFDDDKYSNIVKSILNDKEFLKLKEAEHHGLNRYEHSLRVSYYSYIVTKILNLDITSTARAGLLHDFFITTNDRKVKERLKSTFIHPKLALSNSELNFNISEKERNIILSHMFPIYFSLPKFLESWIVSIVDKVVSGVEFGIKIKNLLLSPFNLKLMNLINNVT